MIDATEFPDVEAAVAAALKAARADIYAGTVTPSPIPALAVTVGYSGGGFRDWGEAAANVGINVYATTEKGCRDLALDVQDILAALSTDLIEMVRVPAGGATTVPRQSPPFQRYFAASVYLRGQSVL